MKTLLHLLFAVSVALTGYAHKAHAKPHPYGIAWLAPVHSTAKPDDPTAWSAWTNTAVVGIAARQSWESLETSDGVYDWSYLDTVVSLCKSSGCWLEITISVHADGVNAPIPSWLLAEGARTVTLHSNSGTASTIPVPWDPVFQAKWQSCIKAIGSRYDGRMLLRVVQMTGVGREGELFFCSNDLTTGDYGWLQANGGVNAWTNAVVAIASFYRQAFPTTKIIYSTGSPLPNSIDPQNQTMQDLMTQLDGQYNTPTTNIMGWRTSGFYNGAGGLVEDCAGPFKGAQENLPFGDKAGPTALYALQVGMEWLEVYKKDCEDQNNWSDFNQYDAATHP